MTISNSPRYDAAMTAARLVGNNFKTLRDNKRKLAVDLVAASVVEGFALQEAITAAKAQAKWPKLANDERNTLNVLFTAVRTIDGAWKGLSEEERKAFLAGEKVYSTLAKEIKDAEKKALEEAPTDKGEGESESEETESAPTGRSVFGDACTIVAQHLAQGGDVSALCDADASALLAMLEAVEAFRSAEAERQSQAA